MLKAGASPTSLAPGDILATPYASTPSVLPTGIPWTHLTADLSPYAGQTVRVRIAVVDNEYYLNAGVDNVKIETVTPPPSNAFKFGKLTKNAKKGSATLTVNVPGPGVLELASAGGKKAKASVARRQGPKKPKKPVKVAKKTVAAAGPVKLAVKPTSAALKYLKAKGSLRAKVAVTFTPAGGSANTVTKTVVLKLTKPKQK